jgi:SAM-dependent methyltransferase
VIRQLERVIPSGPPRDPVGGPDHPMRKATRAIAFDPQWWEPARAREIAELFDGLAPDWNARFENDATRLAPLEDAMSRGGPMRLDRVVDVGCGTAVTTAWLTSRAAAVVGVDLAPEMLRQAPRGLALAVADSAALPMADASVDVAVLMNAFLFPMEIDRVLAPGGVVMWASALGTGTPIYLPAEDVAAALPGEWTGCWAEAGAGTWAVLRRAD